MATRPNECGYCNMDHSQSTPCREGPAKKVRKRRPGATRVKLPKISWFSVEQTVAYLRVNGLLTDELEEAFAITPKCGPSAEDIRRSMKPENRHREPGLNTPWSLYDAWYEPMRGDITISIPAHLVRPMATLLYVSGFLCPDTQRSNTMLRRSDEVGSIDVLDLMAGV